MAKVDMHGFAVGDRVRTLDRYVDDRHDEGKGAFTGTVMGAGAKGISTLIHVMRDDGVEGSGDNGAWRIKPEFLCPIDTSVVPVSGGKHVMGLDHEDIDWNAHREFMKGM